MSWVKTCVQPWWPRGFITTLVHWNFRSTSGKTSGENFSQKIFIVPKVPPWNLRGSLWEQFCAGMSPLKNDATVNQNWPWVNNILTIMFWNNLCDFLFFVVPVHCQMKISNDTFPIKVFGHWNLKDQNFLIWTDIFSRKYCQVEDSFNKWNVKNHFPLVQWFSMSNIRFKAIC